MSEIKVSFVRTTYIVDVFIFINNKKLEFSLFACSAPNVGISSVLTFLHVKIFIKFVTRLGKNDPFH